MEHDRGLRLRYHQAGSGAPPVLLHGFGPGVSGRADFGANPPVPAERLRCLIVDQPGFGASGRPAVVPLWARLRGLRAETQILCGRDDRL
ncbi:hypothetical protein [Nocardia sp. NPDC019304]|uniref:alpha/beta fold hydrolase n=1 Tax=unclassified Nocardia TaxID=2637762 RepID=UPI0033D47B88